MPNGTFIIRKTPFQKLQCIFGNPESKLKALSLDESKKECAKINTTQKEIKEAKKTARYVCDCCGHSHLSANRRCFACGGWLRYWQLYERVLCYRELEKFNNLKCKQKN